MSGKANFDIVAAHRYFAAECFNRAWELMDKTMRTPAEDEEMIRLSLASHWHWTQRPDYTRESASVGFWQTSRVYALLGQADNARRYGLLCLAASQEDALPPFCLGYAYEALARAEALTGDGQKAAAYIAMAEEVATRMSDLETKQQLLRDLSTVPQG